MCYFWLFGNCCIVLLFIWFDDRVKLVIMVKLVESWLMFLLLKFMVNWWWFFGGGFFLFGSVVLLIWVFNIFVLFWVVSVVLKVESL